MQEHSVAQMISKNSIKNNIFSRCTNENKKSDMNVYGYNHSAKGRVGRAMVRLSCKSHS